MEHDVIIVGAGPAGVSAARELKGRADVLVLERLSDGMFGRYHSVCGEGVSERMARRAGIDASHTVSTVGSISISFPGGAEVSVPVRGRIVDRPAMLSAMRSDCDAEFVRATVTSVREVDGSYVLSTTAGEFSCRYLIGADGAHSVVRRDIFGTCPRGVLPVVNTTVPGEGDGVLWFTVAERYGGFYAWRFPSKPGMVSVGFPKGCGGSDGVISKGARHLPFGGVPEAVSGNALLVGDAAGLANALCYGGIGAAMDSGRRAARAVASGRPGSYGRWYRGCIYRNPHFMDAHERFSRWTDEEIEDAMRPFLDGYSVPRGLWAMLRRPSAATVYMSVWMALKVGW